MAAQIPTMPTYDRLMWPTLQALTALGGSGSIQEIDAKAIELSKISDAVLSVGHGRGHQSEVAYRLAWARTYLRAFGAIERSRRGIWAITEIGSKLSVAEMRGIPAAVKAATRTRAGRDVTADDGTNDVDVELVESRAWTNDGWKDVLLSRLLALEPPAFERLCQRVLREAGFTKVEVTGKRGDGGIDGVGVLQIALLSFPVFFQSKRYTGSVGPDAIRDFRGAMVGRTDKGIFLTTGTFTRDAEREATRDGAPAIDLVDGYRLCDLLKDYNLGVITRMVEAVTVEDEWFKRI